VRFLDDLPRVDIPVYQEICEGSADLSELTPTEYRSDAVLVLKDRDKPVMAVVVEVQRATSLEKQWTWPAYLATLRRRLKCPSVLLVISPDRAVARWCGQSICMGHPGWDLTPVVLGPSDVPVVKDPAEASADPVVAILSAVMHATDVVGDPVVGALGEALRKMPTPDRADYLDVVFAALSQMNRENLELTMGFDNREYKSEFAREFIAKGKAETIVAFLLARGLSVPERAQSCITSCTDLERLNTWSTRAAFVDSVDELFG
jgi:hypothetical protein